MPPRAASRTSKRRCSYDSKDPELLVSDFEQRYWALGPLTPVHLLVVFRLSYVRLATESVPHPPNNVPPPIPTASKSRPSRLYPRPRPVSRNQRQALPVLPPSFGRNQLLPVPNSTRALLENIVNSFESPIRYAFAYGSGVFEQAGYDKPAAAQAKGTGRSMLDFVFAVTHPDHWHSINMHQYPGHYPTTRTCIWVELRVASAGVLALGCGSTHMWPMDGVMIKYGVTTVDTLCADLLNWRTLYLAGRMHKPIRIIRDDARVRLTQQVNLASALRTALLDAPRSIHATAISFQRLPVSSYAGDPRMLLPAENRGKVANMVMRQEAQFRELYWRLAQGYERACAAAHLRKLPEGMLMRVHARAQGRGPPREADECAYWLRVAGDEALPSILRSEMSGIVGYPATVQSLKGVVSAGLIKSARYTVARLASIGRDRRRILPLCDADILPLPLHSLLFTRGDGTVLFTPDHPGSQQL
ncbi:mitochondrial matrix Mmp37-domain-containing protein [Boletus edulis BED1]|uniref:Phosphatidate cytidylyltransferase, mitochondrial n=1 Tax=Boletus edulis BED1 TaxID=1328754 RepID=A0AAD4BD28_BOLED|nr:mitochondrial matrix Mmp37-domain-containing protein [Boletus edulis BED1]